MLPALQRTLNQLPHLAELTQVTLALYPHVCSAEQMARPLDGIQRGSAALSQARHHRHGKAVFPPDPLGYPLALPAVSTSSTTGSNPGALLCCRGFGWSWLYLGACGMLR